MSILTINNAVKPTFVPQSQYNIITELTCTESGWEYGATGGTTTCQGIKTVKI